jgi:N6-L-threonylcarbamoyladenine synthase
MILLAIETSCDETGICLLEQQKETSTITLRGNALASQIELHAQYGGVFPALAKRAHTEKILPLIKEALSQASLLKETSSTLGTDQKALIHSLCGKDVLLADHLESFLNTYARPPIDYIAVTHGPGLEPALWVGVNTARVLGAIWNIPLIPINHMEGHIVTAAFQKRDEQKFSLLPLPFPVLSLLVSGGHTELVVAEQFGQYKKIGKTRDDAVGEAFDKVARILGLPYPGGPALSKLAATFREEKETHQPFTLPRPMMHSGDYDFSFSGIKTAVLYAVREHGAMTEQDKKALACEFETAAIEVLIKKTIDAALEYHTPTIIVGGGVAGNTYLRSQLTQAVQKEIPDTTLLFPEPWLATDNAIMIGMAAMLQVIAGQIKTSAPNELKADGNVSL